MATKAKGSTAPAAALRGFYRSRSPVDIFIVVSDEQVCGYLHWLSCD